MQDMPMREAAPFDRSMILLKFSSTIWAMATLVSRMMMEDPLRIFRLGVPPSSEVAIAALLKPHVKSVDKRMMTKLAENGGKVPEELETLAAGCYRPCG
jgi:hypothetical protein